MPGVLAGGTISSRIQPTHQLLYRNHHERTVDIVGHRDVNGVTRSEIDSFQQLSRNGDLSVGADLERSMGGMHTHTLRNLVDFVVMDNTSTLDDLMAAGLQLDGGAASWLLEAAALAEAICDAVLRDSSTLDRVQQVVRSAAHEAGCDFIVGASRAADQVVRSLNSGSLETPQRVLLFEVARVTGATLAAARVELRGVEVVPAVLVDLQHNRIGGGQLPLEPLSTRLGQLVTS